MRLRSADFCEFSGVLQLHYVQVLTSDLHWRTHMSGLCARIKQAMDGAFAHGRERCPSAGSEKIVTFSQICVTFVCRSSHLMQRGIVPENIPALAVWCESTLNAAI